MDIQNMTPADVQALVEGSEDKEVLRSVADQLEVSYSGNTGVSKLKENLLAAIVEAPATDLPKVPEPETSEDVQDAGVVLVHDQEENDSEQSTLSAPDPAIMAALNRHQKTKVASTKGSDALPDLSVLVTMNEREAGISEPLRRAIVRAKALRLVRCRITNLDPADAAVPGALITCYNKYTGKVSKLVPFGDENEHGYHLPKILVDELKSRTFNMRKEKKRAGSSFGVKEYSTVQVRKFAIEELPPLTQEELDNLANDQKARGAIDQAA